MTAQFRWINSVCALAAVASLLAATATASADRFGGFSADESRVLLDRDQVCLVQRLETGKVSGAKSCTKLGADQVAKLKFRAGNVEAGPKAKVKASHRGSRLTVEGEEGLPSFTVDVLDPVVRVVAVQLSGRGRVVAVEYVVRAAGRERIDVLAVSVTGTESAGRVEVAPSKPPEVPTVTPSPTSPVDADAAKLSAAIAKARKTFAKGGQKNAALAGKYVMGAAPQHPEGFYYLAVAKALAKDAEESLAILERMGSSTHPDTAVWRVEARFQKAFASLRDKPRYRAAVALDVGPATLYERLLGFGGTWEQAGTPCTDPTVKLELTRIVPKFKLRIESRCQGMKDTTRLAGTWRATAGGFEFVFPNAEAKDEVMPCQVVTCGGEECLRCQIDRDLSFELASVRR